MAKKWQNRRAAFRRRVWKRQPIISLITAQRGILRTRQRVARPFGCHAYTIPTMNARACTSNGDSQLNDRDVISLTVIDFITGSAFDIACLHFLECSAGVCTAVCASPAMSYDLRIFLRLSWRFRQKLAEILRNSFKKRNAKCLFYALAWNLDLADSIAYHTWCVNIESNIQRKKD